MTLKRTFRNKDGNVIVRVSFCEAWEEYMIVIRHMVLPGIYEERRTFYTTSEAAALEYAERVTK